MANGLHGIEEFSDLMQEMLQKVEGTKVTDALKEGAEALASDVRMLPSPRSQTEHPTHMLDTVQAKVEGETVQVGWGAYYGLFWENGFHPYGRGNQMSNPHMKPTWEANKDRYQKLIVDAIDL